MSLADRENRRKSVVGALAGVKIEPPKSEYPPTDTKDAPPGMVTIPKKSEARSKRAYLLLPPSLYKEASRKCLELGVSLNECVNQLLQYWVQH